MDTVWAIRLALTQNGEKLCPMVLHVVFPYLDILRYGGTIPGQPDGTAVFCCPDVDVVNVFRIEKIDQSVELILVSSRHQGGLLFIPMWTKTVRPSRNGGPARPIS